MLRILGLFHKARKNELDSIGREFPILMESARRLFTQSEKLKKLVMSVKASIERSSSASLEISTTVTTTAYAASDLEMTAQKSFDAMERSTVARRASSELIEDVIESVEELQASVKSGLAEISSIATTMSQIQEKAKVINDIVFQTKLLSFNASVEAARAGEFGKGFSVVAEEMGNLARASGAAAKEIESIITSGIHQTQSQIKSVTDNLNRAAAKTNSAVKNVNSKRSEVSAIFQELTSSTQLTNQKSQQISSAAKEQDLGVQEINNALRHLEVNSVELEKMADENHTASIQLSQLVTSIYDQLEEYNRRHGKSKSSSVSSFDFHGAIQAHIDWKMKLGNYLNNPDGSLHSETVCLDNACKLGRWIYGEGLEYQRTHAIAYENLRNSHAEFHMVAADVIDHIHEGRLKSAAQLMAPHGKYTRVSDETVQLIKNLEQEVASTSPAKRAG